MLKELCITPHIFDPANAESGVWKDINNLLQVLSESGFLIGLNNKDWNRAVLERVNRLDPKIRDKLESSLKVLKDRNRIVGHPKDGPFNSSEEVDWYNVASKLHNIRPFNAIIANRVYDDSTISAEQLEDINIYQVFGFTGSTQVLKTSENLEKILLPFLSYSKRVNIIDPYFYLHEARYKETLEIIAKCFMERRGAKESGYINIHCKWVDDKSDVYVEEWQRVIVRSKKRFNHTIRVKAWDGDSGSVKLHDRYIITNQSGLVSAAGTDKDDRQNSEWSLKNAGELDTVLSQYKENSSPFQLKCIVTEHDIEMR